MNWLNPLDAWFPTSRRARGLTAWGLALLITIGLALVGSNGEPGVRAAGGGVRPTHSAAASVAPAGRPNRVARADAHIEGVVNGDDLEINLTITQTANDCQESLAGGVCLRYSVVSDERAVVIAYGVVPLAALSVSNGTITLRVDTSKVPGFVFVLGAPAVVNVTWQVLSGAPGALQRSAVHGSIGSYIFASAAVAPSPGGANRIQAGAKSSSNPGNTIVATIYMR